MTPLIPLEDWEVGEGGSSHSHPVLGITPTREASPSASARVRAAQNNLHAKHEAVQKAQDFEAKRAACRSLSHANNMLILALDAAEAETREAAEYQHALRNRARIERLNA